MIRKKRWKTCQRSIVASLDLRTIKEKKRSEKTLPKSFGGLLGMAQKSRPNGK